MRSKNFLTHSSKQTFRVFSESIKTASHINALQNTSILQSNEKNDAKCYVKLIFHSCMEKNTDFRLYGTEEKQLFSSEQRLSRWIMYTQFIILELQLFLDKQKIVEQFAKMTLYFLRDFFS